MTEKDTKIKIEEIKRKIRLIETTEDKKTREGMALFSPGLEAHALSEKYEELGNLYLKLGLISEAKKAFERAGKEDVIFMKEEFGYDKDYLERTLKWRKKYWGEKIKKACLGREWTPGEQLKLEELEAPLAPR